MIIKWSIFTRNFFWKGRFFQKFCLCQKRKTWVLRFQAFLFLNSQPPTANPRCSTWGISTIFSTCVIIGTFTCSKPGRFGESKRGRGTSVIQTHDLELTPGLFLHWDVHHFIDILHLRNFHHLLNLRHHWHIHLCDWVAIPTGKGRTEWEVTCDISGCSWSSWARDTDAHQIEKEISDVAITYKNMHSVMMRNYNI